MTAMFDDTFERACAAADAKAAADNQHSKTEPLHSWEAPDWSILDDRRGALPEFPLECLGKAFTTLRRAASGAGVTDAHVAVPLLGIASGLIGVARRVQASRSWLEPHSMWCATVGFSGTGKTPGLEVTKRALSEIERDKREDVSALRRAHESKVEKARAKREAWKKAVKDATESGKSAPNMPDDAEDPGKFISPKLYVSDGTIERLGELLNARPQGITRILDELAGMFANMKRYNGGQDNEFWLEAWGGNAYSVERMGRQLAVDYLLIAVVGGFQPDKLVRAFAGDDDGMYARFLYGWPLEARLGALSDAAAAVDPNIRGALARLDELGQFDDDGGLIGKAIKLSDAARAEFQHLRQFVHDKKELLDGREREWMRKVPSHVLRLAGTLCFLDWAWNEGGTEPTEIEAAYVKRAAKLAKEYFWPHARAALRVAGISERHAAARRALRWIKASGLKEVALLNIRREALAHSLDEVGTKNLLDGLETAGWLQQASRSAGPGRPARRWKVNPLLWDGDAAIAGIAETPPISGAVQPAGNVSALPAIPARQPGLAPAPDPFGIPDFLRREVPPDRRPALGPVGDSLDDFEPPFGGSALRRQL